MGNPEWLGQQARLRTEPCTVNQFEAQTPSTTSGANVYTEREQTNCLKISKRITYFMHFFLNCFENIMPFFFLFENLMFLWEGRRAKCPF